MWKNANYRGWELAKRLFTLVLLVDVFTSTDNTGNMLLDAGILIFVWSGELKKWWKRDESSAGEQN